MKERKISVIVPVYNVEAYLERCLNSILGQTYKNLEVILVDDGSTDKSGRICDKYQKEDSRILVLHQKNQGLSSARNTGLQYVSGEYVSFVDSDDYIEQDACRQLIDYMEASDSDICFFGHYRIQGNRRIRYDVPPQKLEYVGTKSIFSEFLANAFAGEVGNGDGFTGLSVWSGIYRAKLVKERNLLFPSEKEFLSEDVLFNLKACVYADKIVICPKYFYNYILRNESLTGKYREDRFEAALKLDEELRRLSQLYGIAEWLQKGIENCLRMNVIVCLKQELYYEKQNGHKKVMKNIRKIGSCHRVREHLENRTENGWKRRILFYGIKHRKWCLVYLEIRIWIGLEKLIKQ